MARRELTTTPLTRALVRIFLTMSAISGLVSAADHRTVADAGPACDDPAIPVRASRHFRPTLCDRVISISPDYVRDDIRPPQSFAIKVGEVRPGETAEFKVFGLTDDFRYFADLTHEAAAGPLGAQIRAPGGSGEVAGRLDYRALNHSPVLRYLPCRNYRQDRLAFADFTYRCSRPTGLYRTRFMLTLRGTDRESAAEDAPGGMAMTTEPTQPTGPDVLATWADPTLVLTGRWPKLLTTVSGTVRISNYGTEDAAATRLVLLLSLDGEPGPEDRFLGFRDVPALPVGGAVDLELTQDLPRFNPITRYHLLAYVDSSNTAREVNELNNLAVSIPVP